ncbi:VIT1/CCC1 transporter family protein [Thermomonas flagellata]|uniref:VIT1/CCC1 transporter family protein n=1 Tax=Thermomonas flagellata TaxID=2888524 RepID=UPI0023D955AC|nr:VIT family protein [Thermomonas flagellata]
MHIPHPHAEPHRSQHGGWLRAAVLGANDGLISTASLVLGMASARAHADAILLAGLAGMAAGALSMAAGEFVSVSSQADAEAADARIEARALDEHPEAELEELTQIYVQRGVAPALARQVAEQLTAHDGLDAHLRDELGIHDRLRARPVQAALASAAAFTAGALPPVLLAWRWPAASLASAIVPATLLLLLLMGYLAERIAGGNGWRGAGRVLLWGALALAVTAGIGRLFGVAVG